MALILMADDETKIRLLLGLLLRGDGLEVIEAIDGHQAVALLATHRPSVTILDVAMPGRSGLDVCRLIREDPSHAHIGVIVVSANAVEADVLAAGADAFIPKPFSPRLLLDAVRRLASRGG